MKFHHWALSSSLVLLTACGGSDGTSTEVTDSEAVSAFNDLLEAAANSTIGPASALVATSDVEAPEPEPVVFSTTEEDRDVPIEFSAVSDGFFDNSDAPESFIQRLTNEGNFSTFLELVELAELSTFFDENDQLLTVLIPNDAAFAALPEEALTELRADVDALRTVLRNHIILGSLDNDALNEVASGVATRRFIRSFNDEDIAVSGVGRNLLFNLSAGVRFDGQAGFITFHSIDRVLVPDESLPITPSLARFLIDDTRFSTFEGLLNQSGLENVLSEFERGFTLFVPTNEAFDRLGEEALLALSNDPEALTDLLSNHIAGNRRLETNRLLALNGTQLRSLGDTPFIISIREGRLLVNGVEVEGNRGIPIVGGVVYPLARVLENLAETEASDTNPESLEAATDSGQPSEVITSDGGRIRVVTSVNVSPSFDADEAPETQSPTEEEAVSSIDEDPLALVLRLTRSQVTRILDYLPTLFGAVSSKVTGETETTDEVSSSSTDTSTEASADSANSLPTTTDDELELDDVDEADLNDEADSAPVALTDEDAGGDSTDQDESLDDGEETPSVSDTVDDGDDEDDESTETVIRVNVNIRQSP